ncbi:MAG: hypothetical protein SF066_00900 [Thermoanaerobaculia bacterium]|nr:hypothetical protein [Thermoanaerobaculia bacterium]
MATQLGLLKSFPRVLLAATFVAIGAGAPAQALDLTAAQLRQACETQAGHVVVLNESTKIVNGSATIASPCRIVIGAGLELEAVSLTFSGPLTLESTVKAEVKMVRTLLSASAISVSLTGLNSGFQTVETSLQARTGSLVMEVGAEANLLMIERLLPGPTYALSAATSVEIRGGRKFTGLLSEVAVLAPNGFAVSFTGADSLLKVEEVGVLSTRGSVQIDGSGGKGLISLDKVNFLMAGSLGVRLAGDESGLSLKEVTAGPPTGVTAAGAVVIEAGTGASRLGKMEAVEVRMFDVASITLRSSFGGAQGGLKVEKSHFSANGDIRFETGSQGSTEVKESTGGTETARLRAATGAGGQCLASQNQFFAAVMELCL